MATSTRAGIAVTSHDPAAINTGIVDHVAVIEPSRSTSVTFRGLTANGAAISSYTESGFTVSPITASWVAITTFGNPAPSIQFAAPAGTSIPGEVRVAAGGSLFLFSGVDLYSSTTPIPYVITGFRSSSVVFTVTGTLPNPMGQFRTVASPYSDVAVDSLSIVLTDTAAPCCDNPMGIDNLVLTPDDR